MDTRSKASITILRSREEVERLWAESHHDDLAEATVTFVDAPGDRGTEIHVDLGDTSRLGAMAQRVTGADPLAKVKDDLRRFKQRVETGVIPRSDGAPEGELAERKLKHRPAQPVEA